MGSSIKDVLGKSNLLYPCAPSNIVRLEDPPLFTDVQIVSHVNVRNTNKFAISMRWGGEGDGHWYGLRNANKIAFVDVRSIMADHSRHHHPPSVVFHYGSHLPPFDRASLMNGFITPN